VLRAGDQGDFVGDYELVHSPEFSEQYEACEITLQMPAERGAGVPSTFEFIYYQRRDVGTPCAAAK
jgi:hypothetical protein